MLSSTTLWRALFIIGIAIISVPMVKWNAHHPYGTSWDEALYINRVIMDAQEMEEGGVYRFARAILRRDTSRPPAYRIFAMPVVALFGGDPRLLRSLSLISLLLTTWLVYLTAHRLVGPCASTLAALSFILSIGVVHASLWFNMEYTLYLAIAASLYFILRHWDSALPNDRGWVGLGIALGLGAMSKLSFLLVAVPMVGAALFFSWRRWIRGPLPTYFILGGILGLLLVLPWWAINYTAVLEYARYATDFSRADQPWLAAAVRYLLGPPYTVLAVAILLAAVWGLLSKSGSGLDRPRLAALWVCVAGIIPLLIAHVLASNHTMRLLSPVLLPGAVAVGIVVGSFGWRHHRPVEILVAAVVLAQAVWVGVDVAVFKREQWDWDKLRRVAQQYDIKHPVIVHLGNGAAMNPPQISYPWVRAHEPVNERWLWRYEQGEIDWAEIDKKLASAHLIVTAPGYLGDLEDKEKLDNKHNDEFVRRLTASALFVGPIELAMGWDKPTRVVVFLNRGLVRIKSQSVSP